MDTRLRRTPCVGICSTTYGDLVCRGCKRFAHEIVSWNGYSDDQQARVWYRLIDVRDASTAALVEIVDPALLRNALSSSDVGADATQLSLAYELLRRRARTLSSLAAVGIVTRRPDLLDAVAVRDAIDAEFHRRSIAAYEHSYRTSIDG